MERFGLLMKNFPETQRRVATLRPSVFYTAAGLAKDIGLEYFDAGVAAEALQYDGDIISTDRAFDGIEGLRRSWRVPRESQP